MAMRHKVQRAKGGKVYYAGGNSNVAEEAAEKKRGGSVGKVMGKKSKGRLDKRARGGGVGSNNHPFSSAHVKSVGDA